MASSSDQSHSKYDLSFKLLLIGDSGVGKSSLLVSFISNSAADQAPTMGVDFKVKHLTVNGKSLKLTIWDTAGQERFRTLTSTYYRSAHGIILVYDVTRRGTFTSLSDVWVKEVDLYSTNKDCVKMLVGNKVDKDSERAVSREEGMALAKQLGSLFLECSAKTRENVEQCFEQLASKIMEVPGLLEKGSTHSAPAPLAHAHAFALAPDPAPAPALAPAPAPPPPALALALAPALPPRSGCNCM